MNTKRADLLQTLRKQVEEILSKGEAYKNESEELIRMRPAEGSWSVLECLEHLNRYCTFYLPEFEKRIENAKGTKTNKLFRSGMLGNYFAKSMLPDKNGKMKTMNTFKDKNPVHDNLNLSVLDNFIHDKKRLLNILKSAESVNLTKTKTATTLPMLKFRLGDTFRFIINHELRHILQADRALETAKARQAAQSQEMP